MNADETSMQEYMFAGPPSAREVGKLLHIIGMDTHSFTGRAEVAHVVVSVSQ